MTSGSKISDVTYYYRDGRVEKFPEIEVGRKRWGKSYWGCGHKDCIGDFCTAVCA